MLTELIKKSTKIKDGNPAQYLLQATAHKLDKSKSYRKITFGERDPEKSHKAVLLVGETGTGKTTLINTMINYMCGVKREDKIWFEITDDQSKETSAQSQTSDITVYGVYIKEILIDLTIIDTPGYEDTRDIRSHQKIANNLLNLFRSDDGLSEINAVCLVVNASQTRLSESQQNAFDAVQSLFSRDIAENFVLFFTHSSGSYPKNALTAIVEAKVTCAVDEKKQPIYFLFNNCQSMPYDEDCDLILEQAWTLSYNGMEGFFKFLENITTKDLKKTQDVLQKWKQLEANISNLQSRVESVELKRNELKQTQDALEKHKKDVEDNNNFEYTVDVSYREKVHINTDVAKKATCCSVCQENCHYPGCWWVNDLSWCSVMKNNHCTVCRYKCHYSKHVKEDKIYTTKTRTETRTYEDLKKKHQDKIDFELSLKGTLKKELQELEKEKRKLIIDAFHYVETLELIALKTNSLFLHQHIDFLIEKLKEINELEKAGYLVNIKKRAG
ncbi:hypothetical protein E1301_Tti019106 [Triplophysa tibetana]|uniref:AIG1-type G domain-containing protein n=1 Tax=Triplophysa tibetana TaxID=1572043 RepID=A0A5A9NS39_9TELE|nr:hypothetical protein E1301_Tti019106 [Triplophysa tibetana]